MAGESLHSQPDILPLWQRGDLDEKGEASMKGRGRGSRCQPSTVVCQTVINAAELHLWARRGGRRRRRRRRKGKEKGGGLRIDGGRTGGSRRWRPCGVEECSPPAAAAASAVSSTVMKLNEGTSSAQSVSGNGRSLVATRKENN